MTRETEDREAAGREMRNDRLIALFLFGAVCFSPPILRVFGAPVTVFGWPLLGVYIFFAWAVLIILVALHVEGRTPRSSGWRQH